MTMNGARSAVREKVMSEQRIDIEIPADPIYFGGDVTGEQAEALAEQVAKQVREKYPTASVRVRVPRNGYTYCGPNEADEERASQIDTEVGDIWIAVLGARGPLP